MKTTPRGRARLSRQRMRQWALRWRELKGQAEAELAHEALVLAIAWRNQQEVIEADREARERQASKIIFLFPMLIQPPRNTGKPEKEAA